MYTCWILCMCSVLCALHASQLATDRLIFHLALMARICLLDPLKTGCMWCLTRLGSANQERRKPIRKPSVVQCACNYQVAIKVVIQAIQAIQAIQPTKQPSSRCRIQEKLWEAFLQICERRVFTDVTVFAARIYPKYLNTVETLILWLGK